VSLSNDTNTEKALHFCGALNLKLQVKGKWESASFEYIIDMETVSRHKIPHNTHFLVDIPSYMNETVTGTEKL
jgi:hypothetical protein